MSRADLVADSMQIFISYRRQDGNVAARLIHNELSMRFGQDAVFQDIEDIGWGANFVQKIDESIARADVVIVVIGPRWPDMIEQRAKGDDWVRHEVRSAMARHALGKARVVPVLVDGAKPLDKHLPADIDALRFFKAPVFDSTDLEGSVARLTEAVQGETFEEESRRLKLKDRAMRWAPLLGLLVFATASIGLFEMVGLDTQVHFATMRLAHVLPNRAAPAVSTSVVIVGIDDKSVREIGRHFDMSWRTELAGVVDKVASAGARSLVIDLALQNDYSEATDAALEQALMAARQRLPVVVAVHSLARSDDLDSGPALLPRLAPWVAWGLACGDTRRGSTYLQALVILRGTGAQATLWPSLALAAYTGGAALGPAEHLDLLGLELPVILAGGVGAATVRGFSAEVRETSATGCTALREGDLIVYQALDPLDLPPPGSAGASVSFVKVLRGEPEALRALAGRTAIVGMMTGSDDPKSGTSDRRRGVELVAAQIDGLLSGRAIRPIGLTAQVILMLGLTMIGAAIGGALRRTRAGRVWALALGLALLLVLACVGWYALSLQLVPWHYGVLALLAGTAFMRKMTGAKS